MQSVIPPSGSAEDLSDDVKKRSHVRWTTETLRTLVFAFRVLKSAARNQAQVRSTSTWARVASVVMALHHLSSLNSMKCKKRFHRLEREYRAFCDLMALDSFEAGAAGTLLAADSAWQEAIQVRPPPPPLPLAWRRVRSLSSVLEANFSCAPDRPPIALR